ncbi:hypothetical protein ACFV14_10765 [Streptomyces zaomyceticus]|uniref:hypothetical protein n=1 Tax=Streptomyces zaomyceticus TaxID=68286 RepID=UPI0036893819
MSINNDEQARRLEAWWNTIGAADKQQALDLKPDAGIPANLAASLGAAGVDIMTMGTPELNPGVILQTRPIKEFLARKREAARS